MRVICGLPLQQAGRIFQLVQGPARRARLALLRPCSRSVTTQCAAMLYPDPICIRARSAHTATVFMLHGLGDTGAGWADIAELWADHLPHVKFVFPTAPVRPITLNGGMRMTAWHDIISLKTINSEYQEDAEGLMESAEHVEGLVRAEATAGIPSNRIVVAGFSQGGAIALLMLRRNFRLAGVVGLSTYLPLRSRPPLISAANEDVPVFCGHGTADEVVSRSIGEQSYQALKDAGANIKVEVVPGMGHEVWPGELSAVKTFLAGCVSPTVS